MKPSLVLRTTQGLKLTYKMQQAIRLLQLSSLELEVEIRDILESNIMLEASSENTEDDDNDNNMKDDIGDGDNNINEPAESIPVETEDIYQDNETMPYEYAKERDNVYDNQACATYTLKEHLQQQLDSTSLSDRDKNIALFIIDSLDDDGYLKADLNSLLTEMDSEYCEVDEIEAMLHFVQSLEPSGIGARDIQECISIQINQCQEKPWLAEAKHLVANHFNLLVDHNYKKLCKLMNLEEKNLHEVIHLIQSINPRPGGQISDLNPEYIVPDVYVKKVNNVWKMELNTDLIPKLRIKSDYANMIHHVNSTDDATLKEHLQQAQWFIKSLRNRNETILKVASCIVKRQRDFLEYGEKAMKPMILQEIATEVDMHESTISRVTTRKYIHTPRGIFELKYFFSSHVKNNYGDLHSSIAIQASIKKLIDAEPNAKPLSDSKIVAMLSTQGIDVARRTVAKYRESMHIPPSNERKRILL